MATVTERPSQLDRLVAEAGAGPGANAQKVDQTMLSTNTAEEKAINAVDSTSSSSSTARDGSLQQNTVANNSGSEVHKNPAGTNAAAWVDQQEVEEAKRPKSKIALLMAALCMATFLAALDMTIVATALPTIAHEFMASEADYTWIASAYLLAAAASTPTWGKLSDIFGRKPAILVANVVFFVGSLIAGLAVSVNMLLVGRVIQGIGGGGLILLTNICISDLFSMRTRGMYFGLVGMTWAVASAVGPVLGGVFTELVTWRWCFYVNLPCDAAAFAVLFFFLDIKTPKTPFVAGMKAIDWTGTVLIVGGTVMLLLGLEFGGVSFPWASAAVICLIVFGIVTIGIFFVNERFVPKYPLMPLRLFNTRSNIAAFFTCFWHGFVFISGSYFLPLYFQTVLGATPLLSGVYLFPFVLSLAFTSAITGIIIRKTGQYLPLIWFGMAALTLGFGLYISLPAHPSWPRIIIFQIIAGVGAGPNFQSPLIALQSLVAKRDIATATATFSFVRSLSTSISVIVGGVIFQNEMAKRVAAVADQLPPGVAAALSSGSAGANTAIVAALPAAARDLTTTAYTQSLTVMWIFYTVASFVGLATSLLIGRNELSKSHEETQTGLDEQEKARKAGLEAEAARRELRDSEKA